MSVVAEQEDAQLAEERARAATTDRVAIVLLNLGGPDRPESVQPFLQNLFADPAILRVPAPVRWALSRLISRLRAPKARAIYAEMGGGSPLVPNTEAQARALEGALADVTGPTTALRAFLAMRYWHPLSDAAAHAVKAWGATRVILLPLYPQWSTTTTRSSDLAWRRSARAVGLDVPTTLVCCYPEEPGFIAAYADLIGPKLDEAAAEAGGAAPRLLLSCHGLPESVVRDGDSYQWQCRRTAEAIVARLGRPGLDWVLCFQSRVGPMKWIGPSTDDELERAGKDKVPVVVAPVAFVSEHSETLVEIGIEYREKAHELGIPGFARVDAVGTHPDFIAGLARLVRAALAGSETLRSVNGPAPEGRVCPADFAMCCMAPRGRADL